MSALLRGLRRTLQVPFTLIAVLLIGLIGLAGPAPAHASGDRSQINNASTHNVGVFARYKKDLPSQPASFYVLGPGHETDDDFEIVGLYVPANVRLAWGESDGAAATAAPRVAHVLEGEQLAVADLVDDSQPDAVAYQLSLPASAVDTTLASVDALPSFSQAQLDLELETAPLD
jgi:hypothetical protein